MTKSVHFAPVTDMRGKLTVPFSDVTAENLKPKELGRIHAKEMRDWESDVYSGDDAELDAFLASDEYRTIIESDEWTVVDGPAW